MERFDEDTEQHLSMLEEGIREAFADLIGIRATCRSHVLNKNYFRWWDTVISRNEAASLIVQQLEEIDGSSEESCIES